MLGSIAFIILAGLCGSLLFKKIKLPGLIGMLLAGIIEYYAKRRPARTHVQCRPFLFE